MSIGGQNLGGLPTDRLRQQDADPEVYSQEALLSLHLIRSGEIVPLPGTGEFIIGRVSEGQSILPDVDLEPFEAYEAGVSRLHALVSVKETDCTITDLGSSNGTLVNKQPIQAHSPYMLNNKDIVRLGRFDIQILSHKS
ncbi:MAG: FHA domain-containing protein [Chloroflexi bacterium]|nr:FHA domain-containing protein [Chloroflexota bacterium]